MRQGFSSISLQNSEKDAPVSNKNTLKRKKSLGELATSPEAHEKRPKLVPVATDPEVRATSKSPKTVVLNPNKKCLLLQMNVTWDYFGVKKSVPVKALIDTGAEVSVFDIGFVERNLLPWRRREEPLRMLSADGSEFKRAGKFRVIDLALEGTDIRTGKTRSFPLATETMDFKDRADMILGWDWLHENVKAIHTKDLGLEFGAEVDLVEVTDQKGWEAVTEANSWIGAVSIERINNTSHAKISMIRYDQLEPQVIGTIRWTDKDGGDISLRLPPQYRQFAEVFSQERIHSLPAHGPHDMEIDLVDGKQPPAGHLYPLSKDELDLLKEYLDEMLRTGKIRPSKGAAGAPIFFAKQPSGKLRIVVDYRGLNAVTIKDKYPLPLMTQLMETVSSAKYFTKLDLKNGFNLIRIKKGDEWKTAFRTRYGSYEYLVMPFGLTNAPSVFQRYMNGILSEYLDKGVIVYIDDILIYTETEEEHTRLVKWVLRKLMDNNLCANIEKCVFHAPQVEFVGFTIGSQGVEMSKDKIANILDWEVPRNVKEVQSFLGFANFYRRFIKGFSKICRPLTDLTKKGVLWNWTEQCEEAFQGLKQSFTTAPILAHFWPDRAKMIETDASDLAKGGILSQLEPDKLWHPVAFYSKKFLPAELNYDIHDKEMVVIVDCFKEWRHFLIGCPHKIQVFTDHKNLEYFNSTKVLNRRQARWAEILSEFDFVITYRPGEKNGKADALSRRTDPELEGGSESRRTVISLFKPGQLVMEPEDEVILETKSVRVAALNVEDNKWAKEILEAGRGDPEWEELRRKLEIGERANLDDNITLEDDLVCFKRRVWVPNDNGLKLTIARWYHDSRVAGHFGRDKTLELMKRNYYWPNMEDWVRNYVRTCDTCQRIKTGRHGKYGKLKPLEVPYAPWVQIAMDFIVQLPTCRGYDRIWVIVDRFSKMAHFIPLKKTTAKSLADEFVKEIWRLHGLPEGIVSDRDPIFVGNFWRDVEKLLGIEARRSTAFHPQTDGQTERVNQVLEQYLRAFVNWEQDNWVDLLPFAEYCYNNTEHSATKQTPFFGCYGRHPVDNWPQAGVQTKTPSAEDWVNDLKAMQDQMKKNLEGAQARMVKYYDARVAKEQPTFKKGDWVMVKATNIQTMRKSKKLDYKMRGKFKIKDLVGTHAYRLEFPPGMGKIHPVFHVSLLEPYHTNTIPGRKSPTPPPVDIESNSFVVEKILDSKIKNKKVVYLVSWLGYGPDECTWEPYENLTDGAEDAVQEFHRLHARKPRDPRV